MKKFIIIVLIIILAVVAFIMLSSDEQQVGEMGVNQEIPANDTADKIVGDLESINTADIEKELDTEFNALEAELQNL